MYDKERNDIAAENYGESSFQEGLSWRDGRRIVELGALAEALEKSCGEGCSSMLDLRNTESEKRYGFASFFMGKVCRMWCVKQYKNKQVSLCKKEKSTGVRCDYKGSRSYDTFRIISTGMQKFMESLEVPPVSARTLKKREREIGVTIKRVVKKSSLEVTELEQNLCSLNSSAANKEGVVGLKANYEMG